MEEDLRALMLADAGIGAAVGTRVSWGERPRGGASPAIVLTLVSQQVEYDIEGPVDLVTSRVQVDCWATSYAGAKAAARAVSALLSGFPREGVDPVSGGTRFLAVFEETQREQREAGTDDADRYFRVSMDFMLTHQEV